MSKRFSEYEERERKELSRQIEQGHNLLGIEGDWDIPENRAKWEQFGLCRTCSYFRAAETMYGTVFARCDSFDIRLKAGDPIVECSCYNKVGLLTIHDMKEMAYIIELNKKKIGF